MVQGLEPMNWLNRALPWICLVWACEIFYLAANFLGPLFPLEHKWTFYVPLAIMFVSLVVFVYAQFQARAIFDRIEARGQEWSKNHQTYTARTKGWNR
jgi:hypothetical protein